MDEFGFVTHGAWDPAENAIIIKRSILKSKETFAGVLMHEFAPLFCCRRLGIV